MLQFRVTFITDEWGARRIAGLIADEYARVLKEARDPAKRSESGHISGYALWLGELDNLLAQAEMEFYNRTQPGHGVNSKTVFQNHKAVNEWREKHPNTIGAKKQAVPTKPADLSSES